MMETSTIFYIILFLFKIGYSKLKDGECLDENQNKICCAMYHIVDRRCVECSIGTYRLRKHTDCVKCPQQFYGKRCFQMCNCNDHEACDPVDGTCYCKDTENIVYTERVGLPKYKQTSTGSVMSRNITIESVTMVTREPISRRLLVYGLPCVLSAAFITFVVCIIKRKMACAIQTGNNLRKNEPSNTLECEYGYAIIDESKLIEQPQSLERSHVSGDTVQISNDSMKPISERDPSSSNTDNFEEEKAVRRNDDYLQPVSENDQLSSGSDASIENDKPVMNSNTYLHPYNTLSPDWQSHTHVYNDEEQEVKSEGYLNPYQPLQENWLQNTHVYNTAKKQTILSDKLENDYNRDLIVEETQRNQNEKLNIEIEVKSED